ncbi:hypothetical protein AVEN_67940-1 [Araneus ventricosus]|uniref:Uncharacterized protein n=1 Tax=Araneus ventricosus TaxID=182803 RepID=A0A4Y2QM45_ARAVE|nr:hypothetical protein AVEN_67940-1 [Araneus ventricosus]
MSSEELKVTAPQDYITLSVALSSQAFYCRRNSKVVPVDQHTLRSDPRAALIYSPDRDVTWSFLVHSSVFSFLIEISRKGSHFLESSICRQVAKMVAKVRGPGRVIPYLPL